MSEEQIPGQMSIDECIEEVEKNPRRALRRNAERCQEMVRLYPFLRVESSAKRNRDNAA